MSSKQFKSKVSICADCAKSVGLCAWSAHLKPVEGWKTEPVKRWGEGGVKIDSVRVHRLMTLKEFTQLEIVDGGTNEDCYLVDGEISSVEADDCVATLYMD